jgi:hypothetical protein
VLADEADVAEHGLIQRCWRMVRANRMNCYVVSGGLSRSTMLVVALRRRVVDRLDDLQTDAGSPSDLRHVRAEDLLWTIARSDLPARALLRLSRLPMPCSTERRRREQFFRQTVSTIARAVDVDDLGRP